MGIVVELAGVEPASKQQTNEFSTCLVCSWLSETGRQQTTYLFLIPLNFIRTTGKYPDYPCILVPQNPAPQGRAPGRQLVPIPCIGIMLNLLYFDYAASA